MDVQVFQIVSTIFTAVVSSIVTSFITYNLAIAKYRNEKSWELKAKSYQTIIESLSDSIRSLNAVNNSEITSSKPDHIYLRKQVEINTSSQANIRRAIDVGSFIISDDAEARLVAWEKTCAEVSKDKNNIKFLEKIREESKDCLKDLKTIAKRDLKR